MTELATPARPLAIDQARAWTAAQWLALLCFGAMLLWPALTPVHVEGFSASIVALGLHMAQGTIHDFLPFAPINTDYFGLTKLGAVEGVALLSPLVGGDGALRIQMWIGAVLTLAASAYLVRRWGGASWLVSAAVVLLIPGVAESFFFFNDNVPAAGLMLAALALWVRRPSLLAAAVAGVLIGCAIAIRTDTVLIAALAVPLAALETQKPRPAAALTALAGVIAVSVLFAMFAVVHASPLDALRAGATAVKLWDRPSDLPQHLLILIYFVGAPALVLMIFGVARFIRERRWLTLTLALGVPLFVNLALLGKMWEPRQLLMLAPFIGALAAAGVEATIADFRRGERFGPLVIAIVVVAWLASPVKAVVIADGPRVLSGRIAGLRLWYEWQQSVRDDFARIDGAIDSAPAAATTAILTEGWNEDRYLHLELVAKGFRRAPLAAPCSALGEAMSLNGRTVVELSIRQTFVPIWPALNAQQLERYAIPCLARLRPDRVVLLASGKRLDDLFGKADRERGMDPILANATVSPILALPVDQPLLGKLDDAYRKEAAKFGRPASLERAIAMSQSNSPFSRQ